MPAINMAQRNSITSHKPLVTGLSPQVNDALEMDRGSVGSCESLDVSCLVGIRDLKQLGRERQRRGLLNF